MSKSQELCQELLTCLKHKEETELGLKQLNKQINALMINANEAMTEEEVEIKVEGILFKPITEESYSLTEEKVKWDEYEPWFEWLRTNGQEDMIKTKNSVHAGTRKSFLKNWQDDGNELPSVVKSTYFETVKYNKAAVKRMVEV